MVISRISAQYAENLSHFNIANETKQQSYFELLDNAQRLSLKFEKEPIH